MSTNEVEIYSRVAVLIPVLTEIVLPYLYAKKMRVAIVLINALLIMMMCRLYYLRWHAFIFDFLLLAWLIAMYFVNVRAARRKK